MCAAQGIFWAFAILVVLPPGKKPSRACQKLASHHSLPGATLPSGSTALSSGAGQVAYEEVGKEVGNEREREPDPTRRERISRSSCSAAGTGYAYAHSAAGTGYAYAHSAAGTGYAYAHSAAATPLERLSAPPPP